ncbi:unnamed protein product [Bursaphelenchus xylophilus]|uniref:(pine wood nematode) hypothetical protein n=1 Tax=Bursaphelenchus xylophilus TaxID=6326 RepID=A0A1I7SWU9_BURXY|nr:unnamed protein product [Bursaphelenchus xylophilus]CAG9099953.1 unnamed protein product [Bursaphelenchus xylophilus]
MVVEQPEKTDWNMRREKVFKVADTVHGSIRVKYPVNLIIETPQFQRLRLLKQLGVVYLVYPTAGLTRFEHSLGVYHLSLQFVTFLANEQPELNITGTDKLCVAIAGLIHDLGHGPYSHLYDGSFLGKAYNGESPFRHEQGSIMMFDYLLKENPEVKEGLDKYLSDEDYIFIKELIDPPANYVDGNGEWLLKGRPRNKGFLYDILSNKFDGLDTDKFDYFLRDSRATTVTIRFSKGALDRIHQAAKVLKVENGLYRICYATKVKENLSEASDSRVALHESVYQHKTVISLEYMFVEMLLAADPFLTFKGEEGRAYRLSEAFNDPKAFSRLSDDYIFGLIQNSDDPNLEPAQEILQKILKRKHYRKVGQLKLSDVEQYEQEKRTLLQFYATNGIKESDVIVKPATMHRGLGVKRHPIDEIWFYDAKSPVEPTRPHQSEQVTNPPAGHVILYSFSKKPELNETLREIFRKYKNNFQSRFDESQKASKHSLHWDNNENCQKVARVL